MEELPERGLFGEDDQLSLDGFALGLPAAIGLSTLYAAGGPCFLLLLSFPHDRAGALPFAGPDGRAVVRASVGRKQRVGSINSNS